MSLSEEDIERSLAGLAGWQRSGIEISKTFDRKNFDGSMRFVNAVAAEANAQDHHPDIAISWNEVVLTLSSHDVSALTVRDFRLAAAIDRIAAAGVD
jgi:4a-hydroxytetrahydrobiopterin dehydratase